MRLPDPLFARAYLRRAAGFWLGGRLLVLAAVVAGRLRRDEPIPLVLAPPAIVGVVGVA